MPLTLQLLSAFLLGIGLIFALVDLHTRFGPQFRNFSVCLVFMPGLALIDLLSYADGTDPGTRLVLQRLMHVLVMPFIAFSASAESLSPCRWIRAGPAGSRARERRRAPGPPALR